MIESLKEDLEVGMRRACKAFTTVFVLGTVVMMVEELAKLALMIF